MFSPFRALTYLVGLNNSKPIITAVTNRNLLMKFWLANSSTSPSQSAEERIKSILKQNFPAANSIDVTDVSGGCGAMYEIVIQAPQFKGLPIVKQHKMVTEALKEEIKDMHGLRIHTIV